MNTYQFPGCTEKSVFGYTIAACYCNTDLCNSAGHVFVSMTTAVGFVVFTFLLL
ncbi:hypothetical protein DPMN_139661 [Dreissena polymorpha]|uniref:Uncharacterized protein n=1 Tax=Dreissena polymorpha TaxID=45954 RepID=A0A9D4G657_DREPO|nr:hypothetical protein DPMN_139661 [Dreissena polymorpha]